MAPCSCAESYHFPRASDLRVLGNQEYKPLVLDVMDGASKENTSLKGIAHCELAVPWLTGSFCIHKECFHEAEGPAASNHVPRTARGLLRPCMSH